VDGTILIVDGDGAYRSFLAGLLRPRGFEIVQARGAHETWKALDRTHVDLAVIDSELSDPDGATLVRQLRRKNLHFPVIFLSAGWQDHASYKLLTEELGIQRVLQKPFSAYQFIMEVEASLQTSKTSVVPSMPINPPSDAPKAPGKESQGPRRLHSDPSFPAFNPETGTVIPPSSQRNVALAVIGNEINASLQSAGRDALVSLSLFASSDEVVRQLHREHFDGALFMLDPSDPDEGFAEATELLCSEHGKDLPVGFVCSRDDVQLQVDAIHAGGVAFLASPVDTHGLRQAASTMAQQRRGRASDVVLVADTNQSIELRSALEPTLVHLEFIHDAYALLEHLTTETPDLLLFDLDMPGVSGLDVCKLLRASPRWSALPIALIGSSGSSEARIAAFEAGADDYMIKPVDEEELLTRVRARVQRHRATRDAANKDPLTGLLRRHAFVDRANAMLAAATRSGSAVAFAMLSVKDDASLTAAGKLLSQRLRAYDLRARWSDDEIILALADVDAATAKSLLERLLADPPFDVAVGIAVFPDDKPTIVELVRRARRRARSAAAGEVVAS
jgi:DNA-binding response OmpR family regulator